MKVSLHGVHQLIVHLLTFLPAAPSFTERGAGLALGPNAQAALRLLSPGAWDAFQRVSTNNALPELRNTWFTFRRGDVQGGDTFQVYCTGGQTCVHRAKFLDELVSLLPEEISHFNKRLTHTTTSPFLHPNRITLHFTDGTSASHSCLIACDGIRSAVRKNLFPTLPPSYSGKYAYRALIPMEAATSALSDPGLAQNAQMYLGRHAHILTMPIDHGATLNLVAFASASSKTTPPTATEPWIHPADKEELLSDFEGWVQDPVQKLLNLVPENPPQRTNSSSEHSLVKWHLFDHLSHPVSTYSPPRSLTVLVGDAAHASTPHNGSGAGLAIEDALILSRAMKACQDHSLPFSVAFRIYSDMRLKRTQDLVKTSRRQGELYDLEVEGIGEDLKKLEEDVKESRVWIWGWTGEREVMEVEDRVREEKRRKESRTVRARVSSVWDAVRGVARKEEKGE